MEDDDDTSIGLPSLGPSGLSGPGGAALLDSDQEDELDSELCFSGLTSALTSGRDLTGEMAGAIAGGMIQAALAGALQPHPPSGPRGEGQAQTHAGLYRGFRHQSSSELDTDLDGEDFELLDQSELSQVDSSGAAGQGGARSRTQGPGFLSNLLGKPQ